VFVPLLGRHNAVNALAAIAVARYMRLPEDVIIASLARARGPEMRLQLQTIAGITLLNDAYNANPASVKAALETLCALPTRGRRVAILGDMRERGESTEECHREVGQFLASCPLELLLCVGEKAQVIAAEAQRLGFPDANIQCLPDTASAAAAVGSQIRPGD